MTTLRLIDIDLFVNRLEADWQLTGKLLSLVFIPNLNNSVEKIKYMQRCMTLAVQRYHRKATALIDFADRGDFPDIK